MPEDGKEPAAEQKPEEIIWTSILDSRYTVTVNRLELYRGELTIRDGNRLIHTEKVGLMYGAQFGPDADDVATWEEIALKVVDAAQNAPDQIDKET